MPLVERERLDVAAHGEGVVVAGDRPEAGAVGLGSPVHRVVAAQPPEGGVGHPGRERVVRGQVGVIVAVVAEVVVDVRNRGQAHRSALGLGAAHRVVPPAMELPTWR